MLHDAQFFCPIQTTKGQPKEKWQKNPFGLICQEAFCHFGLRCQDVFLDRDVTMSFVFLDWDVKMSFVFLDQDVKKSFVFLDWDVKRRGRISLSLARRLPTPCSSNKRPDNLFLHSLVYWSSLGRPRHLNKSTNTQIQQNTLLSSDHILSFQSDGGICRDVTHRSGEN